MLSIKQTNLLHLYNMRIPNLPRKIQKTLFNEYKHFWNGIYTSYFLGIKNNQSIWNSVILVFTDYLLLFHFWFQLKGFKNKKKNSRTVWGDRWLIWWQNPFDFYHTWRWRAWLIVDQQWDNMKMFLNGYKYLILACFQCSFKLPFPISTLKYACLNQLKPTWKCV